jgi:hypothetical protein
MTDAPMYVSGEQSLCGLDFDGQRHWVARPFRPFTPQGLLIWGAPPFARVRRIVVAGTPVLIGNSEGVPARWFGTALSFEQLQRLIAAELQPPQWGSWPYIDMVTGMKIELVDRSGAAIGSEVVEMVLWGAMVMR